MEEAENGRDAPANGNAENEENGEQEADNEVDEEEEEGGEEEEEEEEGDGEEEDGDEDEEAEAATGKRAAEDDEVGSGLRGRGLGSCTVAGRADGTRVRLGCCMFLSGSLILNGKELGPRFPELQSLWSCQ